MDVDPVLWHEKILDNKLNEIMKPFHIHPVYYLNRKKNGLKDKDMTLISGTHFPRQKRKKNPGFSLKNDKVYTG